MKKIGILGLFFSSLMGYAQEIPYSVSYQDRGATIRHATCRLAVFGEVRDYTLERRDYLNQEFINLLSMKGYRIYQNESMRMMFGQLSSENQNIKEGDLALKMETLNDGRKHHQVATLSHITKVLENSNKLELEDLREFASFKSKTFNMSPNRVYAAFVEGEQPFIGSPKTLDSKKGRKSLFEIYNAIPECLSEDSGHSYEEDIYNHNIVQGEINSCIGLYNQDLRRTLKTTTSLGMMLSNFGGYGLTAAGLSIAPIALPIGVGVLGHNQIKKLDLKILRKNLKQSIRFMQNVGICFDSITEGKACSRDTLTRSLNKKNKKRVEKYLELMSQEELTQKIADYLGNSRACSMNAVKIRKLQMNNILKETRKTL